MAVKRGEVVESVNVSVVAGDVSVRVRDENGESFEVLSLSPAATLKLTREMNKAARAALGGK